MGYAVHVLRGNVAAAIKQMNRMQNGDNMRKLMREAKHYKKPGERRRLAREECVRRHERFALMRNLRTVFARKARGF